MTRDALNVTAGTRVDSVAASDRISPGTLEWLVEITRALADGTITEALIASGPADVLCRHIRRLATEAASELSHSRGAARALRCATSDLGIAGDELSTQSNQTSRQARNASLTAEQVSQGVAEVAMGIQQLGGSIQEIAQSAQQAAQVAAGGVDAADEVTEIVNQLGDSGARIGKVVRAIEIIAQQTNLLALNATIEAARAGSAGSGFAVVAREVKLLAKETARATREIAERIEGIQTSTSAAVDSITRIASVIRTINDHQKVIATAVGQQSATASSMSDSVSTTVHRIGELANLVDGVAEATRETATLAEAVHAGMADLGGLASSFEK